MATSNLIVRVLAETSELSRDLKKAQSSMAKFETTMKRIGGTIAAAFATDRIVAFASESAKLAAEAEGVRVAFNKLDGVSLQQLRKQTQGTFDDLALMKSAVEFGNFKLPLDKLGTLLQFVQMRAAQTGKSFEHLRDSLIEGLAKESKLRIDNLGISVGDLNNEIEKTGDFTSAVAAIAEREIGKMAGVTDTTKNSTQQLGAAWTNLQLSIGAFVNSGGGGIIPFLTSLVDNLGWALKSITQIKVEIWKAFQSQAQQDAINQFTQYVNRVQELSGKTYDLEKAAKDYNKQVAITVENLKAQGKMLQAERLQAEIDAVNRYVQQQIQLNNSKKQDIELTQKQIEMAKMLANVRQPQTFSTIGADTSVGMPGTPSPVNMEQVKADALSFEETLHRIGRVAIDMSGLISGAIGGIAEAFGNAIATGKGFGQALLQMFGNFMKQLRQMMIATGLAAEKFKKFLLAKPGIAIAAGIALVALGAAFNSAASGLVSNLGGGGSGPSRVSGTGGDAGGVLNGKFVLMIGGRALKEGVDWQMKREEYIGGRG